ncbi:MAG: cytochrome c [bacterium]
MIRRFYHVAAALASLFAILLLGIGCQGTPSENPPIHLNPDMDQQPRYEPQAESKLFEDGASMREPVPGTVARGELFADDAFYRGHFGPLEDSNWVKKNPTEITLASLKRGQERFDIYCSPCHSKIGDGRGIMVQRGYLPPPDFHQDRIRAFDDGYIFDVITHGVRNMPAYAHQIPPEDRWAIVAYVRALQRSQNAKLDDVPVELRDKVKQGGN